MGITRAVRRHGVALAFAGIVVGVCGLAPATADAAVDPAGYDRVKVTGAGFSLALPDDWNITEITRAQAKVLLDQNPQLVEQGATVDSVLAAPLTGGWDGNGDGYSDRYINVQLVSGIRSLPSPDQARLELGTVGGIHDLTVKRATVAKQPALAASYSQDITRDDGTPETVFGTTYIFVPRGKAGVLLQLYHVARSDPEFDGIVKTVTKSVKFGS